MKKIIFIIRGNYKRKKIVKLEIANYFGKKYSTEIFETKQRNHAIELTFNVIESGCDYLISVGGDGTLNEVVNGYMLASPNKRENVAVGLIPGGTGNDFARTIGLNNKMERLFHLIENKSFKPIDLVEASFFSFENQPVKRFYINIADIGVGANAVQIVNSSSKKLGANLTFLLSVLKAFIGFKHLKVRLTSPEINWSGETISLIMANGQYFGSGIGIAPQAKVDDGKIELVIVGNIGVPQFMWYLPKLRAKKMIKHPEISYKSVSTCRIDSETGNYPIEMDGEYVGHLPLDVKIHQKIIKFLF